MPRVAVCLMAVREKRLEPVYVACDNARLWRPQLKVELGRLRKGESLHDFLRRQEPVWYRHKNQSAATGVLAKLAVEGDCMLAPIRSQKRLLGILYADTNGGTATERQFEEFQLVANQINMFLCFNAAKQQPREESSGEE